MQCEIQFQLQDLFKKVITIQVILLYSHVKSQGRVSIVEQYMLA